MTRLLAIALCGLVVSAAAAEEMVVPVVPPPAERVLERTVAAAGDDAKLAARVRERSEGLLVLDAPAERLSVVLRGLYEADERVRAVVEAASAGDWGGAETAVAELPEEPFVATNVRAFVANLLISMEAFDEAAAVIETVDVGEAVDPAGLLFLKAVCQHAALDKEAGLKTIARLLAPGSQVPQRYDAVARLMRQDLEDIEDNDLNKLSRKMKNVQRQLRQGKGGKKTQEGEQEIIEGLDKMIEGIEQQLKKMQGQGQMVPGNPLNPAEESQIGGPKGEGEVDKRPIGKSAGWGDLPPKARTEARNLIENQFPPHYRRAVEEYYKKLAERE